MNKRFDQSRILTRSLTEREHKMSWKDVKPLKFEFKKYSNPELNLLTQEVVKAHQSGRQVILSMGAHPLRCGNSRFFIDLMERGIITHIATNGAVPIHDFELSAVGATLEDVEKYIAEGKFGNWQETSEAINGAVVRGYKDGLGMGESIGRMIELEEYCPIPNKNISIFAAAYRLKIPITVHKGIGYDITDQHQSANFAAIGKTSGDDFLIFADSISKLQGGVFLSMGSQVMGPEVYLKALSMARNIVHPEGKKINNFTTGVFDLVDLGNWRKEKDIVNYLKNKTLRDERYYFRPLKSILIRTVKDGGKSFYIKGDFNMTIPAFYHSIIKLLSK